jgi:hypothetical protein
MGENDPSVIIERKERLDMSQSAVEQVVGKMLLDTDFRQQMAPISARRFEAMT